MTGFIYKHTNKVTGKIYIGQTTQKPETRWGKDGINYKTNIALHRDIVKYSWDSFTHEVIEEVNCKSKRDLKSKLDELENQYILEYRSMLLKYGYNSAVTKGKLNVRLTTSAKRFISMKMEKGLEFEAAYITYKNIRRK